MSNLFRQATTDKDPTTNWGFRKLQDLSPFACHCKDWGEDNEKIPHVWDRLVLSSHQYEFQYTVQAITMFSFRMRQEIGNWKKLDKGEFVWDETSIQP